MLKRKWTLIALAVLLVAALIAFTITREATTSRPNPGASAAPARLVNETPLLTALSLANAANTAEEQQLATEAMRVADHEVDLAFAMALQHAQLNPPPQNSTTIPINARIHSLESHLHELRDLVARLTKLAGKNDGDNIQQQLEVAQARVTLLKDALDDAREDLVRAGGDPQAQIQQELEEHEALQHHNSSATQQTKPASFEVGGSLISQYRTWQRLGENQKRLRAAQQEASTAADTLTHKHEALEKGLTDAFQGDDLTAGASDTNAAPQAETEHAATMANLNEQTLKTKLLSEYDRRIQDEKQLADMYGQWDGILQDQLRVVLHSIFRSLIWIFLALLFLVVTEGLLERFYANLGSDRRHLSTMRLVLRLSSQILGVMFILLVLFGMPSQLSTVLALAGAGLTVALKDFIVAFFGWFILMGKHGIREGDWVEINGIGGEVVEIGVLRTILLETGNWNDAGHPTGRKVSFVNSFAIEGHYFNFTTTGQWLWDELDVLIPAGEDPYFLLNSVLKLVAEQTQADATEAEQEWRRVTHSSATQSFSAAPAIDVRPTNLGINLVVRYVVHAHDRYEVRTRLYQAIVALLHGGKPEKSGDGAPVAESLNPEAITSSERPHPGP
jgi:small-conductance mechanosensitive channel